MQQAAKEERHDKSVTRHRQITVEGATKAIKCPTGHSKRNKPTIITKDKDNSEKNCKMRTLVMGSPKKGNRMQDEAKPRTASHYSQKKNKVPDTRIKQVKLKPKQSERVHQECAESRTRQ